MGTRVRAHIHAHYRQLWLAILVGGLIEFRVTVRGAPDKP